MQVEMTFLLIICILTVGCINAPEKNGYDLTFSGNGYNNTTEFYLEEGETAFILSMTGDYNKATLYDSDERAIDTLFEKNGEGIISKSVNIQKSGNYYLEMNATFGTWTASIEKN